MFKLLIVDDERLTREGIIKHLNWNKLGIGEIEQAENGLQALEICRDFQPDIILSDIRMAKMNGIEFIQSVKDLDPDCSIIFMSAYTDKEYYKAAIQLKVVSFIEKPIDLSELETAIKNAITTRLERIKIHQYSKTLQKMQQANADTIKAHFTIQLTRPNSSEQIQESLKYLKDFIPLDGHFLTVTIALHSPEALVPDQQDAMKQIIDNQLDSLCPRYHIEYIWAFKDINTIIIHFFTTSDNPHLISERKISELCRKLYTPLKKRCNVSIGIGNAVKNIDKVYESYTQAALALQKVFYCATIPITTYRRSQGPMVYRMEDSLLKSFEEKLQNRDGSGLELMIRNLTADIRNMTDTQVNVVKNIYFRLLSLIMDQTDLDGITSRKSDDDQFLWDVISRINTLNDLENFALEKLDSFIHQYENRSKTSLTVSTILHQIHQHYAEPTFSISQISQSVGLSVAYICVLFRQETGKTINTYITEYRMEKAKALLKKPNLKNSDIAAMVGYNDGDYFSRNFKKITGYSPSEYREKF